MAQFRLGNGYQSLTPAVKYIIIINVICYLLFNVLNINALNALGNYLPLYNWSTPYFRVWQLVTHMFMHGNFQHIFFNMFALWMFGSSIENYLGTKRFVVFYLICGVGAACCFMLTQNLMHTVAIGEPMIGASGAIMGLLFAFGYLYPNVHIFIYFLIPMRAKYFVGLYAILELFFGVQNRSGDNVAHFAHLGGMLFAFIMFKVWNIKSNKYIS